MVTDAKNIADKLLMCRARFFLVYYSIILFYCYLEWCGRVPLWIWPDTKKHFTDFQNKSGKHTVMQQRVDGRDRMFWPFHPVSELCFGVYSNHSLRYINPHTTVLSLKCLLTLRCCHPGHDVHLLANIWLMPIMPSADMRVISCEAFP